MIDHDSPARPHGPVWRLVADLTATLGCPTFAYQGLYLRVLSSAEQTEYRGLIVPHNHVSVSVDPEIIDRRPTDSEMGIVRHDFDMEDAEEDNHQPGRIRNLFLPLHLPRGTVGIGRLEALE